MGNKAKQSQHQRVFTLLSRRLLCSASFLAGVVALGVGSVAHAEDRHWDANGTGVGTGGTGTWDLGAFNWSPNADGVSGPYTKWDNSALNDAVFGGAPGTIVAPVTVTVANPITVHNLRFEVANYLLSGGTLTLDGVAPTITAKADARINSILAGTKGLIKAGAGSLDLYGTNIFSGDIWLNAGRLYAVNDAALGALSNNIWTAAGASVNLRIDGASTGRTVTIGDGGTLNVSGSGVGSARITGNGNVSVIPAKSAETALIVRLTNDSSDYTGITTFRGCSGICNAYFSSIGNLGEASSLGAPTTVENGTIYFAQVNNYTDNLIYIGDGDSSNRNWKISGTGAIIRNEGTGALTITGDIVGGTSTQFIATSADINLLGTISGGAFAFSAETGRAITLGNANTFTGTASLGGTVRVGMLANSGVASSLGAGSAIAINAGELVYTGTGANSDRAWTINGASSLVNDGTGALALSGALGFLPATPNPDSLTLGGSFAGTNIFSGVISGAGNLISNGTGTWLLDGANSFAGTVTVNNGTLRAGTASAFGAATEFTVNGGMLDLGGFDRTITKLAGAGGRIELGAATLTIDGTANSSFAGSITGAGGSLFKRGASTLTLSGASSYTGSTTINGGTLALDFSAAGAPQHNILADTSTLVMAGGVLTVTGAAGAANSQEFGGVTIAAGSNRILATSGTGGSVTLDLGAINRTGGLIDFTLNGDGAIRTSSAALGGWATVNGTDYAKVVGGVITAFTEADYATKDDAASWANGEFITDADGNADSFYGTVTGSVQLGGLRYTVADSAAGHNRVTINTAETLGVDGAIIVASSVGNHDQLITGGSLTGASGGSVLGLQQNSTGNFTIASTIVDNAGAIGFTKAGSGAATLTGANLYTGATTLSGGLLQINSIANGGVASAIGASSADASNLVLENGTLKYSGATASTDRGFTLVNGGTSRTIDVIGGTNLTFNGVVTSPDDAGFTKLNAGTLTLANAANTYRGVTTVGGGTLAVTTLTDGGLASSIGMASSDPANIVLAGGTLAYLGGTASSNRGVTIGAGHGFIDVTDANSVLTLSGTITSSGTGGVRKGGPGTLILSGTNSYAGDTIVNAGTLRAGSAKAFGPGTSSITVNSGGTLDLGGFNITTSVLMGQGTVNLGAMTLTTAGGSGVFTGKITGSGGLTRTGNYTQALSGCQNDYTGATVITSSTLSVDCLADGGVASGIGASSNAASNLVLNAGTLVYTGGSVTIDRAATLQSGWNSFNVSNAATTLTITGVATGSGALDKSGAGTLILTAANLYTGGTRINGGTLRAGSAAAFGPPAALTLANAAGVTLDLAGYNASFTSLAGGGATGGVVQLGGADLTLTAGGAAFAGKITGTGSLIKGGSGTQQLSGCANDYSGSTTINGGIIEAMCLTDGGLSSSIGMSGAAASNLVLNGGTLRYIGAGNSTNRRFTLGAAGGTLDASGTGTIDFTSTAPITFSAANKAQTLTLDGTNSGNNILAAQLTNNGSGLSALTKTGTGTWVLTNSGSSYTGITRIDGGVLAVDKLADGGLASSIGASSAAAANLVIGNESTLRYTGTGDTTNRLFTLALGTTYIESSGTGALVFTDKGPVTLANPNQARTIALGGTNTGNNILAGSIGNAGTGITTLAKNDSGTWVLTGNHSYTGNTVINGGILILGNGGTTGAIVSQNTINQGLLVFNRSDSYTYGGVIANIGAVEQRGSGTTILTGANSYTGGTTISAGTLQLGNGGTTGSIKGDVLNNGVLAFDRSDTATFGGLISGTGAVTQRGSGTTILTATNSYDGGTSILGGTLQVTTDANLGAAAGAVSFNGGTLRTAASFTSARTMTLAGAGTLLTDAGTTFTLAGEITGAGSFTKSGAGTLVLTGNGNTPAGGTTIAAGTLQLGTGGTSGALAGDVVNNGALVFNRSDNIGFDGLITGNGSVIKNGAGVLTLTAGNGYRGATTVNAGTLRINGDQSAATGLTSVAAGAALGGAGTIGGNVVIADNGILAPGDATGTLTIAGNLSLSAGSILDFEFGAADVVGGPLNDLVNVGGDLVLDGIINVSVPSGGSFGGGIYRVFNYGGTLTDNGLALGTMPGGSDVTVQTSVAGQVNLVNSTGLTLSFWDGDAGPKFNDAVDGGNGIWHLGGADNNWTDATGAINAAYADATYAIFSGAAGTVTVDNGLGPVRATGMQFASDGYRIDGGPLTLVGPQSVINVGDHTALGAGFTATVASELTGASQLVKTDLGTLVLTGVNSYTGGTLIDEGALRIASDANLGDAAGAIMVKNGTLQTTANIVTNRAVTLTGAATLLTDPGTSLHVAGSIGGVGSLTKAGTGALVLTGDASHSGGTTIAAGTLQVGNGGTTGSLAGNVINNGALIFNRSNALTFAGMVSGAGSLTKLGAGTLTMTGLSSYTGSTTVDAGKLVLQSGGQINGTSTFQVGSTGTAEMVVDGPGSQLVVGSGTSFIGRSGNGTLTVQNGGVVSFGLMTVAANAGSAGAINIIGAGSRLTNSGGGLQNAIGFRELATLNIRDGGTMASTGASVSVGFASGAVKGEGVVDISGAGSRWDVAGALDAYNGAITVADGGVLTAGSARFGIGSGTAMEMLVTGGGARFETSGALTLGAASRGVLTIADGGVVRVGGGTLAMGPGDAVLNIGGAEGGAAAHAGFLDAAAVTFGAAGNRINFNHDDANYLFSAAISGAGTVNHNGPGNTVLTGTNSYSGGTVISAGGLYINGDQSGATGPTLVAPLATLGGTGTIGGDVLVVDGVLNPGALGSAPGTLTINGSLGLTPGATLNVDFGQADVAGGAFNDLINVGGDLGLDGTLNVRTAAGGSFDPGIYRVINYGGVLSGGGLTIGTIPSPDFYVQTSVANQVNLVNTAGLQFRYWDGPSSKNDGVIDGGDGLWQRSDGNDNWVDDGSIPNAPFADDAFAVFMGAAGEVTVDGNLGDVTAGGMQFLTDGYVIGGEALTLVGTQAFIRTGDGTAAGAGITATIDAELTGAAQMVKSDLGTLILTGPNSYTGGTAINGGTLQVSMDSSLGEAAGGLAFSGGALHSTADITSDRTVALTGTGTLLTDGGTTLGLTGAIGGAGGLVKDGAGTLVLTGDNSYAGQTRVNAGMLVVNGDQSAATGLTGVSAGATLAGSGTLGGNVTIADGGILAPGNSPGTLTIAGDLSLSAGSVLNFEFGEANVVGGALNDLINVGGNLVLDGTLNVTVSAGGEFGAGIYRVLNYGGTLTNNGLNLGLMPAGSTATVQTSVAGQVNLVNTDGLMLNFWDGGAGPKFDNVVNGGAGVWQSGLGNDNWTDAAGAVNAGYADGAIAIFAGIGGQVTVDNSVGAVEAAGLQFAADGYVIGGEALTLTGALAAIRVGDGSAAGADFTATIASDLTGAAQLVKTDAGTLILSGANSYSGGTVVEGGTLAIAADGNLGAAAGGVTLSGGTLRTMASLTSDRAIALTGAGTILTDGATTFTLNGLLSGTGALTKDGAGTLVLTGDNGSYGAATQVADGTLAVDGKLGGIVTVAQAGRLEGAGRVGAIVNSGIVAPGRSDFGTLTVTGDYVGNGGTLTIETVLGDDSSPTSRLVVDGATSGTTQVSVANRGGLGGPTVEGIKIIDVAGASDGVFTLKGDYLFQGEQAMIAGAYGYRLYQGGRADPADGDWYLRSSLLDPGEPEQPGGPGEPALPLYQPGVPVYEVYGANLLALNTLPTLQQRVGNRSWAAGANPEGSGIWGRAEGTRNRANALISTSGTNQTVNSWKLQLGADHVLKATDKGERLVAGVTAYYGQANSHVRSVFGNGSLKTDGYGLGATLSWYGLEGFYLDGQAQLSWYDSDLDSDVLGRLVRGNGGSGEAFSVEAGKRTSISGKLSITPQLQMAYSNVRFDRFADPADAIVASGKGDSLTTRGGISLDHQTAWEGGQSHVYGIVNLSYEWLDGTRTMVSGTPLDHANERLWGELGLGASISWTKGVTLYGEVSGNSPFRDFGDSYTLKANAGVRIAF